MNVWFTPSSKDVFPNSKNGRWSNSMVPIEFLQKISHLQGFFKIVILTNKEIKILEHDARGWGCN